MTEEQVCRSATCPGTVLDALGRASPQPSCVCVQNQNQNRDWGGDAPGLHECLERLGQLELGLLEARSCLTGTGTGTAMQRDSVENRLHTCQVSPAHTDR